jgi:hypothetical protein
MTRVSTTNEERSGEGNRRNYIALTGTSEGCPRDAGDCLESGQRQIGKEYAVSEIDFLKPISYSQRTAMDEVSDGA